MDPTPQFRIRRRGKPRRQLDALSLHGAEAGQAEGDGVGAWPQIEDLVLALIVGHDRADFFNQGGTGSFHGHAGQYRTGRVAHQAGDASGRCGLRPPKARLEY